MRKGRPDCIYAKDWFKEIYIDAVFEKLKLFRDHKAVKLYYSGDGH